MQKKERPKIKLPLTKADISIEVLAVLVLIFIWGIAIYIYPQLPDLISTHFKANGEADGYGNKNSLWLLPAIGTLMFAGFTVLSRFPHIYNYPIEITKQNAESQYKNGVMLMRLLKLAVMLIFAFNLYQTQMLIQDSSTNIGKWTLTISLGLVMLPIIYFLVKSFRTTK